VEVRIATAGTYLTNRIWRPSKLMKKKYTPEWNSSSKTTFLLGLHFDPLWGYVMLMKKLICWSRQLSLRPRSRFHLAGQRIKRKKIYLSNGMLKSQFASG
jgi:hypothetical protein